MKRPIRLSLILPFIIVPALSLLVLGISFFLGVLSLPSEPDRASSAVPSAFSFLDLFFVRNANVELLNEYGTNHLVMVFDARNMTGRTLSRVDFVWQYVTPDREVPWAEGTFSYNIPGGLEHGEVQQWKFTPYKLRDVSFQMKGFFIILPIRLEDAQGNVLAEDTAFGSARGRSTASRL